MIDKFRNRIKKVLVKQGVLDEGKAQEALLEAESSGAESYAKLLLEKQLIDEPGYLSAVSLETNYPPVDLDKVEFQDAALELFTAETAGHHGVLPVSKLGSILTLAVANPFDILKLDDVRTMTGCEIRWLVTSEPSVRRNIQRAYLGEKNFVDRLEAAVEEGLDGEVQLTKAVDDVVDVSDAAATASGAPIVKTVNLVVIGALKNRASDIHIEPWEKATRVRIRVDGILREFQNLPSGIHNGIVSRIKILSDLDIAERRVPQDGKFQVKFEGRPIDFRVSIMPTIYGEKVVLRVLDSSSLNLKIEQLGLDPQADAAFRRAVQASYGWVLVTGPTGSGKTTTLYAALKEVLNLEENTITVEDPVEYQMERVNQVPVNVKRGLTFAAALRSILRQDPDVIMIGETRDLETADIAVKASITGHLVLSTLHTNDAASSVTRLVNMGLDSFMVATAVIMVAAQRLVRRLCEACRRPIDGRALKAKLAGLGFTPEEIETGTFFQGGGCLACNGGYRGRFVVMEALEINRDVQKLIIEGKSAVDINMYSRANGMASLRRSACRAVAAGRTSVEELLRNTVRD